MAKAKGAEKAEGTQQVATNKKAYHDYQIIEVLETGISLKGNEVKSIREGGVNLKDSYVRFIKGEVYLIGCHVTPYSHARREECEPTRDRKLLMHRREIDKLGIRVQQKGLTLIPLKIYFKKGRCKLEIGLGSGKKLYDKRQDLKSKEARLEIDRAMRGSSKRLR